MPADPDELQVLEFAAGLAREHAAVWVEDRRKALLSTARSSADRRQAKSIAQQEKRKLLNSGDLFGSASSIISYYVLREFEVRGWAGKQWRPVPGGEDKLPGRRYGVSHNPDRNWTGKLRVHLPDNVAETLLRATWRVSRPATLELMSLRDKDDFNPVVARRRRKAVEQIVTTGDVLRSALYQATLPWYPSNAEVLDSRLGSVIDLSIAG